MARLVGYSLSLSLSSAAACYYGFCLIAYTHQPTHNAWCPPPPTTTTCDGGGRIYALQVRIKSNIPTPLICSSFLLFLLLVRHGGIQHFQGP